MTTQEYVAEASCLVVGPGQITAQFPVPYLRAIVPLGTFACQRVQVSPLGH